MTVELKPCPFCGSDAMFSKGLASYYVRCLNPDCAIVIFAHNKDEAVMKWNRRVNE